MDIVNAGYMAISFVDEHCIEPRNNFTARQDALVTAGAQIIKTDFPTLPTHFASSYVVCWFKHHCTEGSVSIYLTNGVSSASL